MPNYPEYDYQQAPSEVGSYSQNLDLMLQATSYRYIGKQPHILDYGAGTGLYSERIATQATCFAYDPAPNSLSKVNNSIPVRDPNILLPRSFHAVHVKEVLEHVPDLIPFFSHIARLLVEGGLIMATFRDISPDEANNLNMKHKPKYPIYPLNIETVESACQLSGISITLRSYWTPETLKEDWYEDVLIARNVFVGQLTVPE